jgi:hypothetical protein
LREVGAQRQGIGWLPAQASMRVVCVPKLLKSDTRAES